MQQAQTVQTIQTVQTVVPQQGQQVFLNPSADALFFNSSYMLVRQREEPLNFVGIDQANSVLFHSHFLFLLFCYPHLTIV